MKFSKVAYLWIIIACSILVLSCGGGGGDGGNANAPRITGGYLSKTSDGAAAATQFRPGETLHFFLTVVDPNQDANELEITVFDRGSGQPVDGPRMIPLEPMSDTTMVYYGWAQLSNNVPPGGYRVEFQVFDAGNNGSNAFSINFDII